MDGNHKKIKKQAGAELCQAQVKLGLVKLVLRSSSIYKETEVVFIKILTMVVFHLQKKGIREREEKKIVLIDKTEVDFHLQ